MESERQRNENYCGEGMKFYFETYGCEANRVDSEIIIARLLEKGWKLTNLDEAEIVFVNTCGVKEPTEKKIANRVRELVRMGKKVIILGCLVNINPRVFPKGLPMFGPRDYDKLFSFLGLGEFPAEKAGVPKFPSRKLVHSVLIAEGCTGNCSYCAVRFARGPLKSFSEEAIIADVLCGVSRGAKEIRITAQDVGQYGLDTGTDLVSLLEKILNRVKGRYFLRIGMMNPLHAWRLRKGLARILADPRVYKFLHIPVQSGSDRILEEMHRPYQADLFEKVVRFFRERIPEITIWTDVIVGFPGESEEDFQETFELIQRTQPDLVHISRFWPRPGTEASRKPQLSEKIKKERAKRLMELVKRIVLTRNRLFLGKEIPLLAFDERFGKSIHYKDFFFSEAVVPGEFYIALVTGTGPRHLKGKIKSILPSEFFECSSRLC